MTHGRNDEAEKIVGEIEAKVERPSRQRQPAAEKTRIRVRRTTALGRDLARDRRASTARARFWA